MRLILALFLFLTDNTDDTDFARRGVEDANDSYGMQDLAVLAAWREMVHSVFLFSQRRKGRKGFLWNAGLGGPSGLARDDSRARIYFLAKARRTQRILTECWT